MSCTHVFWSISCLSSQAPWSLVQFAVSITDWVRFASLCAYIISVGVQRQYLVYKVPQQQLTTVIVCAKSWYQAPAIQWHKLVNHTTIQLAFTVLPLCSALTRAILPIDCLDIGSRQRCVGLDISGIYTSICPHILRILWTLQDCDIGSTLLVQHCHLPFTTLHIATSSPKRSNTK